MKRKIAVFTGSRAEYGLLYWLIKDLQLNQNLDLQLVVAGMHLAPEFGDTWKQIVNDGFTIDAKVEMLLASDTPVGVVKSMGVGTIGFADALDNLRPDMLIILGDRFEALAIAQAALIMRIPIAHIHGGEVTEGAYDDAIRHSITKMASLHFVAADSYRDRVIQMGEQPDRVFNVGAIGLDHISRSKLLTRSELSKSLAFDLSKPFFLVTYHPVTLANENSAVSLMNLLLALEQFGDHNVILTYPNADNGGKSLIRIIQEYVQKSKGRSLAVPSLGQLRYLSALRESAAVIGNSSSGLVEAPALKTPCVNVGARQAGRLCAKSVLSCSTTRDAIAEAIKRALTSEFQETCRDCVNPYGQGNASEKIVKLIESLHISPTKQFYDLKRPV